MKARYAVAVLVVAAGLFLMAKGVVGPLPIDPIPATVPTPQNSPLLFPSQEAYDWYLAHSLPYRERYDLHRAK